MVKKVSIWLTLEPLFYLEEPIHLATISKKLEKPHTTVRKQLAIFEKIGLVFKEKKGRQTFYKIRKTPLILEYLTIIEKEKLIEKCNKNLVLKEIIEFLHNFDNSMTIFGSAVDSVKKAKDIDLLIIEKFKKEKLGAIEKRLNIKFHVINVKNLKEINEVLRKEITKKHLIIQGSEKLIKWMIS